jgi:hypothetical protein
MSGERNDVFACGVAGVDQQSVGRPAVAANDVVDHRLRQARIVAPVGHLDRDDDALLRRGGDLGVVGGANCAVGKAHVARPGIGRRNFRLLLLGFVLGVCLGARLALRLKPFERRPRSSGALLNITRRALPRRLSTTARSPRIARKLLLKRSQTLGDRAFDLEHFFARPERLLAGAGANLGAIDCDLEPRLISPSAISAVTLCVSSRSRTSTLRPGSRRARDSSAARRPPATDKRRRFAQAAPVRAPTPRPRVA